jgi:hypothetical protein
MEKTPISFYTVRFNDCDPLGHLRRWYRGLTSKRD